MIANDDMPNHGVLTIPLMTLPADLDRDVDGADLAAFSAQRPEADINHDQHIDNADIWLFVSYFGRNV